MGRWGEILSASPDASVTIFECNLIMTGTENRRSHPRQGSETMIPCVSTSRTFTKADFNNSSGKEGKES
jgi:hypothetical protein